MNILFAFIGWLLWTWGNFTLEKDGYDDHEQDFPARAYIKKNWDNWIFNALVAAGLIMVGMYKLGLDAIPIDDFKHLQWNDLYYAASGVVGEILMKYLKKFRDQRKNG
jgi:hypothetical protein